jgi:hypothetical protein
MSDAVSITVRCIAIAEDIVRPVLETMRREEWPDEFRGIVLSAITRRFQEETDKAFLAHRKQLLTDRKAP